MGTRRAECPVFEGKIDSWIYIISSLCRQKRNDLIAHNENIAGLHPSGNCHAVEFKIKRMREGAGEAETSDGSSRFVPEHAAQLCEERSPYIRCWDFKAPSQVS